MKISRTKIVGGLMVAVSLAKTAIDALNGGGFDCNGHFSELMGALGGSGLIFLRSAIDKLK